MKRYSDNVSGKKISHEMRIYELYHYLIEFNVIEIYLYSILNVIETLQILYFGYRQCTRQTSEYELFLTILEATEISPFIHKQFGDNVLFISWIIYNSFLVFAASLFVFCTLQYSNSKPMFIGRVVIQILSIILLLMRTILVIPGAYLLCVPIFGTRGFPNWSGLYIIVSLISFLSLALHIMIVKLASLLNDCHIRFSVPWASPSQESNFNIQLFKLFIVMYTTFDENLNGGLYVYAFLICMCFMLISERIYGLNSYHQTHNFVLNIEIGCFFIVYLFMYIRNMLDSPTELDIAIIGFLLGCGFGVLIHFKQQWKVEEIFEGGINMITEENLAVNSMVALSFLPHEIYKRPEAVRFLLSILKTHFETCKDQLCICKEIDAKLREGVKPELSGPEGSLNSSLFFGDKGSIVDQFGIEKDEREGLRVQYHQSNQLTSEQSRWLSLIGMLLEELCSKFPSSINLCLLASFYQEMIKKNYYKSFFKLLKLKDKDCSFGQQLAIHRMKVLLDQKISSDEAAKSTTSLEIDLNVFVTFENRKRELEEEMQDCSQKVMQFWGLLIGASLKIDKMYLRGGEISNLFKKIHDIFNNIIQLFPDHINTYIKYTQFLRLVANNDIEADEYNEKARQISKNIDFSKRQAYNDETGFSINKETAVIIMSGGLDSLGIILNVNEYVTSIFGYSYSEVVGSSINRLLPSIIAKHHDQFLLRYYESGKSALINKDRLLFGQSKIGLLIPVAVIMKTMPDMYKGLRYIGFLRRDMRYIKKNLIKLPYQYQRTNKINFIMTDNKGSIISISERTATTIGIPKTYFERKKVLFSETFNISHLNHKFTQPEAEEEFKKGTILDLKLKTARMAIDRDFINSEEQEVMENLNEKLEVYIQLIKYEFGFNVRLKIYIFVAQSLNLSDGNIKKLDKDKLKEMAAVDDTGASSTGSQIVANEKVKSFFKDVKKNIFEQKESRQITLLKRIIYISMLIIFGLSVWDLINYELFLNKIEKIHDLETTSHKRRNLVSTLIEQFQSYRHLALGIDTNSTPYEQNRGSKLKELILQNLELIKHNEYDFQDYIKNEDLENVMLIIKSPGIKTYEILINYNIETISQGLFVTVSQIISKANRIVNEISLSELQTNFITNIYNKTYTATSQTLTQSEKDMYFILINGLNSALLASSQVITLINEYIEDKLDSTKTLAIILHSIRAGVALLMIIILFPIIQSVQSGKRAILQVFAEVPKKKIEMILKECEDFFNHNTNVEKAPPETNSKPTPTPQQVKQGNFNPAYTSRDTREGITTGAREDTMEVKGLLIKKEPNDTPPMFDTQKFESNQNEGGETDEEANFRLERKQQFAQYKAGIGLIFLILLLVISAIAGYQSVIFVVQLNKDSALSKNQKFMQTLENRLYYLSGMFIYYMSSTSTYQITPSQGGYSNFVLCLYYFILVEEELDRSDFPSQQQSVTDMLQAFIEQDFCDNLFGAGILNQTAQNSTWCHGIQDGLLKNGIKSALFYLMMDVRRLYTLLLYRQTDPDTLPFYYNRLIYEYVLVPAMNYLIKQSKQNEKSFINASVIEISLHYGIFLLIILISVIVLIKFFAKKLNTELWNANGIVSLLPYELITSNESIKEMFNKQMNIIIQFMRS